MKTRRTILILFITLGFSGLQAQVTQEWVQRYNGPGNVEDEATSIAVDASGNVYVTGFSVDLTTKDDFATIKYNPSGVVEWIQRYNGQSNFYDRAYSLAVDDSGNVYVTGRSYEGTWPNYMTIKYNSSGVQLWNQRYPTSDISSIAYSVAVDDLGNVYVTGSAGNDYATIKYNSSGVQQWAQRYNGLAYDNATSLAVDDSGNVYVTGESYSNGIDNHYATIKYNSSGVQQWIRIYDQTGGYYNPPTLALDNSGNIYLAGTSIDSKTGNDYLTIKYNSSGIQLWVKKYNGPGNGNDYASSLAVDGSDNVYVTGGSEGDCITIKYNSSGIPQWIKRYIGGSPSSLAIDGSGNVYVTGSSGVYPNFDFATIKYNSTGVQQWVQNYNGPGGSDDHASSLAVDASGNVYVTGYSFGSGSYSDYATIKYSQLTGITQTSNSIPEKFSLSQNYPNPFNPKTIISYQCSMFNFVSLKIFDVLGNEVTTLVNEKQNAGTYSVEWDAGKYSSGIYFYRLQTDDFIETKKMTLIK